VQGRTGVGTSARYELSRAIMERVEAGEELGDVMDAITGQRDVRSQGGAMGTHARTVDAASRRSGADTAAPIHKASCRRACSRATCATPTASSLPLRPSSLTPATSLELYRRA
jgi:hypothetical protein